MARRKLKPTVDVPTPTVWPVRRLVAVWPVRRLVAVWPVRWLVAVWPVRWLVAVWPVRWLVAVVLSMVLLAAGCSDGGDSGERSLDDAPVTAAATNEDTTASSTPGAGAVERPAGIDGLVCRPIEEASPGRVRDPALIEASGVVASRRHDGVLWAHNDSGGAGGIHGFNLAGDDLGFYALGPAGAGIPVTDVEDIALFEDRIYLADIGDNLRQRSSVAIHVFDEPAPGGGGNLTDVSTIEARYPDGPSDAEALLVDPASGGLLIMSKDLDDRDAPTRLYALPPQPDTGTSEPVTMELVGSLDVAALSRRSSAFSVNGLLFPGSVTGADVSDDGSVIAVRTYGSVWLFARAPGRTLAQALASEPCEGGAAAETQGESVGFLPDDRSDASPRSIRYVTVSEGTNPPINVVTVEIGAVSG